MDLGDKNIVQMIAKVIEEASDTDDNRELLMAGRNYLSIQEFASAIPNHLLLGSLLEHLCFVYESNPARSRTLFKVIGQHLAALNLLSPLAISDEFSTVRLQHNRAFTELLHAASSSLYPQGQQRFSTNAHNPAVRPKEGLFQAQTSRYLSEFEEIRTLGKGSYGKVCEVKNKLDGQSYAVKKILIKKVSQEDCRKVLREVKMLSSLQHVHVVGYHTAWMEHVQPAAPESLLPALEPAEPQDSSEESPDGSSTSGSIVFESPSRAPADAASSTKEEEEEEEEDIQPIGALLPSQERGQVVCPKTMRRIPQNYVPCVFLGQPGFKRGSRCPASGRDSSVLFEDESSRSSVELNNNNNSCIGKECQQRADICTARPVKEVQFHLMLYIQMQLCERSLKDWISIRNRKPKGEEASRCPYGCVDPEHTLSLLRKILEGVEYIHSKGIMHRDLKPGNIFLQDHDCHVRIGDFGLACKDIIMDSHESLGDSSHTKGVGTAVYAAPEKHNGSHYDLKSDMYSIGVLAFELFQPFGTEMERAVILRDLTKGELPHSFCKRWPVLTEYIKKLTSQNPEVRPTASQLLQSELFCNKDIVIHGLQKTVEEQAEEIMQLKRQISELQSSQVTVNFSQSEET